MIRAGMPRHGLGRQCGSLASGARRAGETISAITLGVDCTEGATAPGIFPQRCLANG